MHCIKSAITVRNAAFINHFSNQRSGTHPKIETTLDLDCISLIRRGNQIRESDQGMIVTYIFLGGQPKNAFTGDTYISRKLFPRSRVVAAA